MSDANSTAPLLGEDAPAKPSLLGTEALSARQALLDDRIRTLSLVICASAVLVRAPLPAPLPAPLLHRCLHLCCTSARLRLRLLCLCATTSCLCHHHSATTSCPRPACTLGGRGLLPAEHPRPLRAGARAALPAHAAHRRHPVLPRAARPGDPARLWRRRGWAGAPLSVHRRTSTSTSLLPPALPAPLPASASACAPASASASASPSASTSACSGWAGAQSSASS